MSEARVRVSLTEGILEFEGSETFVAGQVEKFARIIQAAFAGEQPLAEQAPRATVTSSDSIAASEPPVPPSPPPSPVEEFKDLFAPTDTGVQILAALPGASKAGKAMNGAKR